MHSRSRLHVELSAQVLLNSFATYGRVNNIDVPQTALSPAATAPATNNAIGASVRQTRFGLATSVNDVAGGSFSADMDFDLFGGVQNGPGDRRLFPEPRLRTVRAHLTWSRTDLMFGSDTPLISDLNPLSLASIGTPEFSGAGNLWNWLGQIRLTREIASAGSGARSVHWAVQGAVMSPYAATIAPGEPDAVDAGERSARPAVEGRFRMRWGDDETVATVSQALIAQGGGEIGVGLHRGWVMTNTGVLKEAHAVAIDAHAVLAPGIEVRGEGYGGRLLRGLGGGAIAQGFGTAPAGSLTGTLGPPIRDVAGWAQLNVQPHPLVLTGIGCGIDLTDPKDNPTRFQNTVCAVHAEWRPAQPMVVGGEFRQIGTRFSNATYGARHFNLALGFEL